MREASQIRLITTVELVQEHQNGALILDTRPAEQFAAFHIRGSIQISLLGHFAAWAAMLLDPKRALVLIAEDERHAREAHDRLTRVGMLHVIGYCLAIESEWQAHGIELANIAIEHCKNIYEPDRQQPPVQLIDVRSRAEWLKGHLPGAVSLPLLEIESNKRVIDPSKPSLMYCHEGFRATTAASLLLRINGGNIGILIDGIEGWLASGFPLEMPRAL